MDVQTGRRRTVDGGNPLWRAGTERCCLSLRNPVRLVVLTVQLVVLVAD
jgi:hypothetical protein